MRHPKTAFDQRSEGNGLDNSNHALISVVVSVFNLSEYLIEALESVADQSYPRLELIVVDDASSDDSVEVSRVWMARFADRFERVLLLQHERNQGLAAARNTAFAAAEAEAAMVLDADNTLSTSSIARLWETMKDSGADCVYSQLLKFGEQRDIGVADVWRREGFLGENYIDAMALVSRKAWAKVGGYTSLSGWEDYDFWCRFVEEGLVGVFVPELLCRYRVRKDSMLHTETGPERPRLVHQMAARHPWLRLKL